MSTKVSAAALAWFVLFAGCSALAEGVERAPALSERNLEVPFCYLRQGKRTWPILRRPLEKDETFTLTARRNDEVLGSGTTLKLSDVALSMSADGKLVVDAGSEPRDATPLVIELEMSLRRNGREVQSQRLQVRPAPPPRPLTYIADLVDDLIRIFSQPEAGRFKPLSKDGFDQYFRRLQAHGMTRLIVWHSPFPYFTRPEDHDPTHWQRYERQARAILDCDELSHSLEKTRSLPSWLWLRFVMAMRLNPEAGPMFVQSAAEHGIALTASFRPFESALTKYYDVPTFDADGNYLWGFLPLATPVVNYAPEQVCFGHYRVVLDRMGKPEMGRLSAIELPGVTNDNAAELVKQFGPTGGFELRASRFPPIDAESFVLVQQPNGEFRLKPFSNIRTQAEARRQPLAGFRLERGEADTARLVGVDFPNELRFLILTHTAAASDKPAIALDKEFPVRFRAAAGNRLNRETVYWMLDEATPAGRNTRIAAITASGEFRSIFDACTSSIKTLLDEPQRIPLQGKSIVIDRGDLWSVELMDFQQPAARRMASTQLKTLFAMSPPKGGYDEIFLSTRSHVDLAPTIGDGEDGQKPLAHYYRTRRQYLHHLGLDKAYAPRSVADNPRLRDLVRTPESAEQITTWQDGEWRNNCQSPDSPFAWRLARNVAVADGVTQLLRELERDFPSVRIRAIVPPRESAIDRILQALDTMPSPGGGTFGRDYYRRLWCSNNHSPATGEGMAMVDLSGTRVEPVFLGSGAYQADRAPFEMFVREQIADLADNRGSSFRKPRSYFYEGQFTLRAADPADARKYREATILHLLSQKDDIGEVLLYEAADWLYFLPLSDPTLCGHGFLDGMARKE
jgi:hypothetical protein